MTDHFTAAYNALCAMRDRDRDAQLALDELSIKKTEMERITTLLVGAGYHTLADIDHAMASLIELRDRAELQQEALRIAGYEGPDALSRALERLGVLEDQQETDEERKARALYTQMVGRGVRDVSIGMHHSDGAWRTHPTGQEAHGARIAYDNGHCFEVGSGMGLHRVRYLTDNHSRRDWVEDAPCLKPDPKVDDVMRQMEPKKHAPCGFEVGDDVEWRDGCGGVWYGRVTGTDESTATCFSDAGHRYTFWKVDGADMRCGGLSLHMRKPKPKPTPPINPPTVATGTGNTLPMSGCEVPRTTRVNTPYPDNK